MDGTRVMQDSRNAYKSTSVNLKGRGRLRETGLEYRIILKRI